MLLQSCCSGGIQWCVAKYTPPSRKPHIRRNAFFLNTRVLPNLEQRDVPRVTVAKHQLMVAGLRVSPYSKQTLAANKEGVVFFRARHADQRAANPSLTDSGEVQPGHHSRLRAILRLRMALAQASMPAVLEAILWFGRIILARWSQDCSFVRRSVMAIAGSRRVHLLNHIIIARVIQLLNVTSHNPHRKQHDHPKPVDVHDQKHRQ